VRGPEATPATYAAAGVDIEAGEEAVDAIRSAVESTRRAGVIGSLGGFSGLFELDLERYRHPVLVSATDGIGTKLEVARLAGRFDTVGIDAVAMCVDDLVCVGAEPLYFLDYLAVGRVVPERIAELVGGIAEGCRQARCALIGGETAEHGGVMAPDALDVAGFAVGVVERSEAWGPHRVVPGDVLVGLASPGLRSNGYTLARHVLLERAGRPLDAPAWEGATTSLADELLRPSTIYAAHVLDAAASAPGAVHAAAHITGGGLAGNLVRALPEGCRATVERSALRVPAIFAEVQRLGDVADAEMARVFNLGVGMVLVVAPAGVDAVASSLAAAGIEAAVVGEVHSGEREVVVL
jgi:phosphoribosylformylglycinamidine cyclo-ligase